MISPGEIQVGMFVTVYSWQQTMYADTQDYLADKDSVVTIIPMNDNSYKGEVLEVIAIDLPFVAVRRRDLPLNCQGSPFKLDTRNALLMELKKEYVAALLDQ